jgi:hypothetical protein
VSRRGLRAAIGLSFVGQGKRRAGAARTELRPSF